jgi:P-type Ca2+ transporter type 2C
MEQRAASWPDTPTVQPVHTAVKGRGRFRVSGLYRSPARCRSMESGLLGRGGIREVSASPLTGNVVVIFDGGRDHVEIAALIESLVQATAWVSSRHTAAANRSDPCSRGGETEGENQETHPWHALGTHDAVERLQGSATRGLSSEAAAERLGRYGPNRLPEANPRSGLGIFVDQFKSLPVGLLTASAALSVATGGIADAVVIMGVVLINAVIGYATETQAEMTINALSRVVRPAALVVRDGTVGEVNAEEVVRGDLLVLSPGSSVPADARLIEVNRLSVDESALTGESMPVQKIPQPLERSDAPLAERTNMVYMGTVVTGGGALAVAVATGRHTEIGRIQAMMGEAQSPETPMQRQLDVMGNQMVWLAGGICGAVFVLGLTRGYGFLQMLKASVSLAVAAVPEGLPTVATTTLALGIRRMRSHKVLIRHLDAVETLGALQVICLDKTGTLTANMMSVVRVYTATTRITVASGVLSRDIEQADAFTRKALNTLLEISALCNETEVHGEMRAYTLKGSPTESALVRLAIEGGLDVRELRQRYPLVRVEYRSESRSFMATVHGAGDGKQLIAVKGSPSEVLNMCRWHLTPAGVAPLTEADRQSLVTENEQMASDALRVLGMAYAYTDAADGAHDGLIWAGLVGMADPVRDGVKSLVERFHAAGINTIMITGDQSATAYAIGKTLDLSHGRQMEILDSTRLDQLDPAVLTALAQRVHVFARVSPAHKLQIVQALQRAGKVVAMTGDGINDGPALKAADIGIALGTGGTEVARTVADVVIEDDDLQTMAVAVSQGRTIYRNIRKSIHFLLATNLSEITVMFAAIAAGIGQPLNPMQLLWINLVSDIFPGLALAMEPPEPEVLSLPPRNPEEPILRASDLKRITFESTAISAGALASYGYGIARYGIGPQAGTMAFTSLTAGQLLHALSCRSQTHRLFERHGLAPNRPLGIAVGGSLAVQFLSLLLPPLRTLLGVTPLGLADWLVAAGGAVLPLVVNEATKGGTHPT